MKLVDVEEEEFARGILYQLLAERPVEANISHDMMPSWTQHDEFYADQPYDAWYLIRDKGRYVGSIYLTEAGEIGITIPAGYRQWGFGEKAVKLLMKMHPREKYLANISVKNEASMAFFKKLGFEPLQQTFIRIAK